MDIDFDFDKFLKLAQIIHNNLDKLLENNQFKLFIKESEDIINKYSKIWTNFDYYEVISCYVAFILLLTLEM
jgi:hypothetical protein